jgi:hypothetical protein
MIIFNFLEEKGTSTILVLFLLILISLLSTVLLQQYFYMQNSINQNYKKLAYYSAYSGAIYVSTLNYADLKNEVDPNKKYYIDDKNDQYFTISYDSGISEVIIQGYYKHEKYVIGHDISESVFNYKALDQDGNIIEGTESSDSVSTIIEELEEKGFVQVIIELFINMFFNFFK